MSRGQSVELPVSGQSAYICPSATLLDMEYLKTLGSAAVSSIVQKSGLNLPFSLGKKHSSLDTRGIWTLYDATKRVYASCLTFIGSRTESDPG